MSGTMISFRLIRIPETNLCEIRHPIARMRRLGVAPAVPGQPGHRVLFDRVGHPVRDRLTLSPLDTACLPPELERLLGEISTVLGPPIDVDVCVAAVANGRLRRDIVESLLRLMAPDQLETVARRVIRAPALLRLLQTAMPHDRWLTEALLAQAGVITWIRNEIAPGQSPQLKAYGHAFRLLRDLLEYRWTAILDADEYLGPNADIFATIQDYIAWQEHHRVDAVALRWLTFVGRDGDARNTASSTARFVWRAPQIGPLFKSLCRTNMFAGVHAHFPYAVADAPYVFRREDGAMCYHMAHLDGISVPEPLSAAKLVWVTHYVLRSANEALVKMLRGDAWHRPGDREAEDRMKRILDDFVSQATNPSLVRDERMLRFAARHAIERTRLQELAGIADCNAGIQAEFRGRLLRVATEALAAVSTADPTRAGAQFCRMLQTQ